MTDSRLDEIAARHTPTDDELWAAWQEFHVELLRGHKEDIVRATRAIYAKLATTQGAEIERLNVDVANLTETLGKAGTVAPRMESDGEHYTTPEHGWTCFHCGTSFPNTHRGWQAAGYHFGWTPEMQPACRIAEEEGGLPKRLRAYEDGQKADKSEITRLTSLLSEAEARGRIAGLEEAAKVIDDGIEVCSAGGSTMGKRRDGDVNGLFYAKAIRALTKEPQL